MKNKKHTTATTLIAGILAFTFMLPEAKAWKPRTHALTANSALADAADSHICLPGLSPEQIPIGETPLVGTYVLDGEKKHFNDLANLGPYVRAGSFGPDAWPDAAFGQLAIHVDHSRFEPISFGVIPDIFGVPDAADPACNAECQSNLETLGMLRSVVGDTLYNRLLLPLHHFMPQWRSIDYGHEVMKRALTVNDFALRGATREEMERDPFLRSLLAERQAAIAFAQGYLMHFAGDSQAHTWVNEIVGQPFSLASSRRAPPAELETVANGVSEELAHYAIEKYIDARYEPQMTGESCPPVGSNWAEDATSICDLETTEMPVDCDQCNPLRVGDAPPSAELSDTCDRCFEGCNPWKEICPAQSAPNLPCAECKGEEEERLVCDAKSSDCIAAGESVDSCADVRRDCIRDLEVRCAAETEQACCDAMVEVLVRTKIMNEDEAKQYSCQSDDALSPSDMTELVRTGRDSVFDALSPQEQAALEVYAPNGCYQGRLEQFLPGDKPVEVKGPDGETIYLEGQWGLSVDLNADDEEDLINECMLWNCLQNPASCPLRALREGLPEQSIGNNLICDNVNLNDVVKDPSALLKTHSIGMTAGIYKKLFLERRYPADLPTGSLGTYSLGGFVPNAVYVIADMMQVSADALEGIRRPITYIADSCTVEGSPECQLAAEVAAVGALIQMLADSVPFLIIAGITALGIPLIGPPIALTMFGVAATIWSLWVVVREGAIPGLTLPLRAKREELLAHLEDKWYESVAQTADAMSGVNCTQSCGGIFPEDGDCTQHRFLGLHNYFDWALEAYEIVGSLDCDKNNYWSKMEAVLDGEGTMSVSEVVDVVESGGAVIATQYLSCKVMDALYTEFVLPKAEQELAGVVFDKAADPICEFATFYALEAQNAGLISSETMTDEDAWRTECRNRLAVLYQDNSDPVLLLTQLRELTAALDNGGLTDEQKAEFYPQLEALILLTSGVQVDVAALDQIGQVLDCTAAAQPIVGTVSLREWLFPVLKQVLGEDTAAMVESIDRELGHYEELLANGFDELNPIPVDLERFYPLYNTIQLNKLSILGDGVSSCETKLHECLLMRSPLECKAEEKGCLGELNEGEPAGLYALAVHGNAAPMTGGFAAAYDVDPIDTNRSTFLQSFFQSQGYQPGEANECRGTGWNILCNSVYSLDDPDDYCRNIEDWSPAYLDSIVDEGGIIPECGKAIGEKPVLEGESEGIEHLAIDEYASTDPGLYNYAPSPQFRVAPSMEPRPYGLRPWEASPVMPPDADSQWAAMIPPHRRAHSHRMYVDRVVPQDFGHGALPNWSELASENEDSYYPYETTRFALANKDSHIARIYANVLAPYYCPEMGANQSDVDCDTIPDACDNCPHTYNPDQLDTLRIGIGDECPGYSPFTGETPESQRWSLCEAKAPTLIWDSVVMKFMYRWIIGPFLYPKK